MMKTFIFSTLIFLVSSCAYQSDHQSSLLKCRLVGETIIIEKSNSLLDELAILRPNREISHFIVVQSPPPEMRPLMTTDELSKSSRIEINTRYLEGLEWIAGAESERVFTTKGIYTIILSETLESEIEPLFCTVFLKEDINYSQ